MLGFLSIIFILGFFVFLTLKGLGYALRESKTVVAGDLAGAVSALRSTSGNKIAVTADYLKLRLKEELGKNDIPSLAFAVAYAATWAALSGREESTDKITKRVKQVLFRTLSFQENCLMLFGQLIEDFPNEVSEGAATACSDYCEFIRQEP